MCQGKSSTKNETVPSAFRRYVQNKFKIDIPPNEAMRHRVLSQYLDLNRYEAVLDTIVAKANYVVRHVETVPGAQETIVDLQTDGHFLEMTTSSSYEAHIASIKLLQHIGLNVPTRSIGRKTPKRIIAKDYDIFFEDRVDQAESCYLGGTPFVYLLTTPTNQEQIIPDYITRLPNWFAFRDEVRTLAHRLYPQSL